MRAMVMQQRTQRPVQFEIAEQTRDTLANWIRIAGRHSNDHLFPSRVRDCGRLCTRRFARIVVGRVRQLGLDPTGYGTHTMRRTKASLVCRQTKDLRVIQLGLGYTKLESTMRNPGIEVEDALDIAAQTEV